MEVSSGTLRDIEAALARYRAEVEASRLRPSTKKTYIHHAETFVRWLKGDVDPGGNV